MRWRGAIAAVATVVVAGSLASGAGAASRSPRSASFYLGVAQHGLGDVQAHWWDPSANWYYDTYNQQPPSMPLARLWSAFPLFETLVGQALAQPNAANEAALVRFANAAQRLYWNPLFLPFGGYDWYPNYASSTGVLYYDDAGWFGLGFVDTYRVTGKKVFLADARKALDFIVYSGWDPGSGGVWWETGHDHKTIEPLAAALLIATRLYEVQHRADDLRWALKLLSWANAHSFDRSRGLYQRSATDDTVMDYVQGLMIESNWELCKTLHKKAYCTKARRLANAAWKAFPHDLGWAPQYDVVYLRWMLEYGQRSGDTRWYQLAADNAERALANARNGNGYFENQWDGRPLADGLEEEAANLELFAWLAATAPTT